MTTELMQVQILVVHEKTYVCLIIAKKLFLKMVEIYMIFLRLRTISVSYNYYNKNYNK
jgi:hypothetical protein